MMATTKSIQEYRATDDDEDSSQKAESSGKTGFMNHLEARLPDLSAHTLKNTSLDLLEHNKAHKTLDKDLRSKRK